MADEVFRLPKSSYDELVKIIKAYGSSDKEVSLPEVKQASGMHETIISSNNAFLSAMGIIEGGKGKKMTSKGRALAIALQHNIPEQVSVNWRDIVLSSDFLRKMVTAVSIRGGMEYSAFQSHIAYSVGEPKKSNVMAGAGAVIEILKIAGLLAEDDGKLIAKESASSLPPLPTSKDPSGTLDKKPDSVFVLDDKDTPTAAVATSPSGISIQIQIQCSANELPELGPKIRALLKELSKPEEPKQEGN
jgi:hypothetical protein